MSQLEREVFKNFSSFQVFIHTVKNALIFSTGAGVCFLNRMNLSLLNSDIMALTLGHLPRN